MNLLIQLVVLSLVSTATCWAFTAPLDRSSIFLSSSNRQLFHLLDTGIPLTIPPPSPQYSTSSSSLLSLSKSSLFSASSDNENELEHRTDDDNADTADIDTAVPNWKRILLFNKYNTDGSLKSNKEDDDMTFKQKLAKMGLSALLSYGFVSNISYCVTVSMAWYGFSVKTRLSPLAPGQWKGFLAVYAGFYVFNNFIRPMRLALSVAVTPYFDKAVDAVQRKTKLNKKVAIGIVVFLANICGTTSLMSLGVYIASLLAGIPIFPSKVV